MWLGKLIERSIIKGYDFLLTGDMKTTEENSDKTKYKGVTAALKCLKNRACNELIIYQEDILFPRSLK